MAIGDDYLIRQELKDYMGLETDDNDDLVDDAISSASREIERHCHRQFNDAGTPSARVYHATNCHTVITDDFHTEVGLLVEINESGDGATWTTVDSGQYELLPLNKMMHGMPWVYWRIKMVDSTSFPVGRRAGVRVTARWGWEAVPADVKQACKMLASDTFQLKDSRMGVAGSDQFGTIVRVKDNSLVGAKLKHFTRQKVLVK